MNAVLDQTLVTDGDAAFLRVNMRKPAHALSPGEVAAAINTRFDEGRARPRFGIGLQPWGTTRDVVILSSPGFPLISTGSYYGTTVSGLTVGESYVYTAGNSTALSTAGTGQTGPTGTSIEAGATFIATQATYILWGPAGETITATVAGVFPNTCGYARFSDPIQTLGVPGFDNAVLLTDDFRDATGEDGGRGRCWRILPGNDPLEVELNGHDVWGTARLEQAHHTMIMARHGNERHYFSATRVLSITDTDATADTLTVTASSLTTGEACEVTGVTGASGVYYLRKVTATTVSLYDTSAHAVAGGGTGLFNVTVNDETGTLIRWNADPTADLIQLNATPAWVTGDLVLFKAATDGSAIYGSAPPNDNTRYYVRNETSNRVGLYDTAAHAAAGGATGRLDFGAGTRPVGHFYLERQATLPGPSGNGSPVLILQPNDTQTAFEAGWAAAPTAVQVTDSDATGDSVTAPSHRLLTGDQAAFTLSTDTPGSKYVRVLSDHVLALYDTQAHALAGGATGLENITADNQTGSLTKTGAAALPIPPMREFCYHKGRIIGVVWGTVDSIVISDPFDFLHYSQFTGTVNANLGESGNVNWLRPLGEDALLIGKDLVILVVTGLSGASTGWKMDEVSREYGGLAPLAASPVGTDVWPLTRKGVATVVRTIAGEKQALAGPPKSADLNPEFADIDWLNVGIACSGTWNDRYFVAVPGKGQDANQVRNNRVYVYNFTNQNLRVDQSVVDGQVIGGVASMGEGVVIDSWEGRWEGVLLLPYAFARLKVFGEERLTFATADGLVCWFTDDFQDYAGFATEFGGAIHTELTPRGYFGGALVLALRAWVNWDTFNPKLSVQAKTAGYNEETDLLTDLEFDRTKYLVDGQEDYDPDTSTEEEFDAPHRSDYSPSASELLVAKLDVHQNMTENLRMRLRDRAPQLIISNTQGSVRINSVQMNARTVGLRATRQT